MTDHTVHDSLPRQGDPAASTLIASLDNPQAFGHPVQYLRMIETHISWVLLTGHYAYKVKKPVDFGFLDFSSLEKRRHYCAEELRLNRRFAPEIYLEVVEIRGSETMPHIGGQGEVVEYAIKMLEFPQRCLLSARAANGELDSETVDAIADSMADIHATSEPADPGSDFGSAAQVARWSDENLVHIAAAIPVEQLPNSFFELKRWYHENGALLDTVEMRRTGGRVRDCHGDLHLGNMTMIDDRVRFFDCIEFNPELRWIDTASETAFVAMDLHARGYPGYCWRFLNRYFERSGDYEAVALLRYYFVYRALVRAKVEALRAGQQAEDGGADRFAAATAYIDLAAAWARGHRAGLILMHGLSGSGKSTVAAQLVERLGAIQIRSDIERKRVFGYAADDDSGSATGTGIYTPEATAATYDRLHDLAAEIVAADFTVIVDATLLKASQRQVFLDLEPALPIRRVIVDCEAPEAELRRRIVAREDDASEASLDVLEHQIRNRQPLGTRERAAATVVTVGEQGLDADKIDEIRARLFA
jgi:aminoglycoside phosphotransferase family enzyme/predicted kinase